MGLLLRYDEKGCALRSVGDPPNGVLAVAAPNDKVTFVIDDHIDLDPAAAGPAELSFAVEDVPGGITEHSTPVSVGEAFDACAGDDERRFVVLTVVGAMQEAAKINSELAAPLAVEYLQGHVDFISELRDVLNARGMLRVRDNDD